MPIFFLFFPNYNKLSIIISLQNNINNNLLQKFQFHIIVLSLSFDSFISDRREGKTRNEGDHGKVMFRLFPPMLPNALLIRNVS